MNNFFKTRGVIIGYLNSNKTKKEIQTSLKKISSDEDLINFLNRYVYFNNLFAPSVLSLSSAVHCNVDLFVDRQEKISYLTDISSEIAGLILSSAEDEYCNKELGIRISHRTIAKNFIRGVFEYFNILSTADSHRFKINKATNTAINDVKLNYFLNYNTSKNKEETLFNSIGFHLGSELLADIEFNCINDYITKKHKGMHKFLLDKNFPPGINSYAWIKIHTFVEKEHSENCFRAINMAVRHYNGKEDIDTVCEWVLFGFMNFVKSQNDFFSKILSD